METFIPIIEHYNAINATISQGHFELYKTMEKKHESGAPFEKSDLLYIYDNFGRNLSKRKMYASDTELTDVQNFANAKSWFEKAIVLLIKKGYLGLNFKIKC